MRNGADGPVSRSPTLFTIKLRCVPTDDRMARRETQMGELYESIGRCVVEFSQLTSQCRMHLSSVVVPNPGSPVRGLVEELSERRVFVQLFKAMSPQLSEDDQAVGAHLLKLCHKAHNERNRIDHDAWFVGWGNERTEDFGEARRIDFYQPTRGTAQFTADDLGTIGDEWSYLKRSIGSYFACWLQIATNDQEPGFVAKFLAVDTDGRVVRRDGKPV